MYTNIPENQEREAIILANTNSKNWSLDDFIKSYTIDNAEYKKLDEFAKSHQLCFSGNKSKFRYAAAILKGQNCSKTLRDGSFFITSEDIVNGEEVHNQLVEILGVLKFPDNGNFIESIALIS